MGLYAGNIFGLAKAPGLSAAVIQDRKASGTAGGACTALENSYRVLNTIALDPDSIVSLAGNIFTVQAGTYVITWSAPAFKCNDHQSYLVDRTSAATVIWGSSETSAAADNTQTRSMGSAVVSPVAANDYSVAQIFTTARLTDGKGIACAFGWFEVFTEVTIIKLA